MNFLFYIFLLFFDSCLNECLWYLNMEFGVMVCSGIRDTISYLLFREGRKLYLSCMFYKQQCSVLAWGPGWAERFRFRDGGSATLHELSHCRSPSVGRRLQGLFSPWMCRAGGSHLSLCSVLDLMCSHGQQQVGWLWPLWTAAPGLMQRALRESWGKKQHCYFYPCTSPGIWIGRVSYEANIMSLTMSEITQLLWEAE